MSSTIASYGFRLRHLEAFFAVKGEIDSVAFVAQTTGD